jgi:hypothetical protein
MRRICIFIPATPQAGPRSGRARDRADGLAASAKGTTRQLTAPRLAVRFSVLPRDGRAGARAAVNPTIVSVSVPHR